MLMTTNWAVVGFTVASGGMYTWCTARQKKEAQGMAQAFAGMKMLNEKKARERAEEEAAQALKLKVEKEQKAKQSWYKFW